MEKKLIYAIDFGTSNSLMVLASPEKVYPLAPLDLHAKDPTILQSLLFTPGQDEWFIGAKAKEKYQEYSAQGRFFKSLKRFLPRESFTGTVISDRHYNLQELITLFLRKMRETANDFYQADVRRVVIGRPALYSTLKNEETIAIKRMTESLMMAGFEEITFCPEPVAAAYDARSELLKKEALIFIADFGGGTSDFTVAKLGGTQDNFNTPQVLAMGGVSLAGDAYDGALMVQSISPYFGTKIRYQTPVGDNVLSLPRHLIKKLSSVAEINFLGRSDVYEFLKTAQRWSLDSCDKEKLNRLFILIEEHLGFPLFQSVEKSKIELSQNDHSMFEFHYPEIEISELITFDNFKNSTNEVSNKIVREMDQTLKRSGLKYEEIDLVFMTGGTANVRTLREQLISRFGIEKLKDQKHFHSVISGLGEYAKDLVGQY